MADFGGIAGEQLKSLIERIERLEEDLTFGPPVPIRRHGAR